MLVSNYKLWSHRSDKFRAIAATAGFQAMEVDYIITRSREGFHTGKERQVLNNVAF